MSIGIIHFIIDCGTSSLLDTILLKVASAKYHNYCRRLFLLLVVLITHFSALRGYSIWGIWSQISIICTCIFSYLSIWPLALTATHETMTHRQQQLHFIFGHHCRRRLSCLVSDQSQWPVIYSVKCIEEQEDESPLRKNKISVSEPLAYHSFVNVYLWKFNWFGKCLSSSSSVGSHLYFVS